MVYISVPNSPCVSENPTQANVLSDWPVHPKTDPGTKPFLAVAVKMLSELQMALNCNKHLYATQCCTKTRSLALKSFPSNLVNRRSLLTAGAAIAGGTGLTAVNRTGAANAAEHG